MTSEIDEQINDYKTALMRCRYLDERRLEAESHARNACWSKMIRFGVTGLRGCLRINSWFVDSLLSRAGTIATVAHMASQCSDADVVSFDVFDTLLYRTVEPPDFLKRRSAQFAAQLLSRRGFPVSRDLFLYVRAEEEMRLRRRGTAMGLDSECTLSDIIYQTVKSLCGSQVAGEETQKIILYELDVECHHLRVAPGVVELLRDLRTKGKRIIVASDTYLEKDHLKYLFKHLSIDIYLDAIYASSEYGVGKYSGRLFEKFLELEMIEPKRVIHIGDNYESDVRGAIRIGMRAVYLRDVARLRQRSRSSKRTRRLLSGQEKELSSALAPYAKDNESFSHNLANEDLFAIGHKILGPAFCLFVLHVIEESQRWGVSDIYFLAREGFLLRRIYDVLIQNIYRFQRLAPIRVRYLYVSRLATSLPSVRAFCRRDMDMALFRKRDAELAESLAAFGISMSDVADLAAMPDTNDPSAVRRLFSDPLFSERVNALAHEARILLRRYLKQEGFFDPKNVNAIVDIGWSATIQANLTRAFHDDPEFPTVLGLYFGRRYTHEDDYALSHRSIFAPGVIFDERRHVRAEHAVDHCVEIFEIFASAPHGGTLGYEADGDRVRPVLHDVPTALSCEQEAIQRGILEYAACFAKAYNDYELDRQILHKHVTRRLAQLLLCPTHRQVKALKEVKHSIDWGSKRDRPLVATDLYPWSVFTPARLFASLRDSCWPEGSLRLSRIPGSLGAFSLFRRGLRSRRNLQRVARFCSNCFRSPPRQADKNLQMFPHENDETQEGKGN